MPKNPRSQPASPDTATGLLELPPPPPNPEVQQIALRDITPSLYQPRRFYIPDAEDPELIELARSIRAKGVIQPILLRPFESGYQLVADERRVRASRLDLPELDAIAPAPLYIPAVVRVLTDTEAAEITVEENLRRKDLRPLEEADGVHTLLLLHRGDPLAVAAKLGQTPAWVACRARIHSNLSPAWKELLAERDNPLWFWTAGHIEEVAKLAQEVQDELLGSFNFDGMDVSLTVPELRRYLADLTRSLSRAPFPLDDDTLLPAAGACTHCPLTTLAAPLLFANQGDDAPATIKDARCLNRNCWIEKCHRSAERAAAQLRADHPDLLLVAPRDTPTRGDPLELARRRPPAAGPCLREGQEERRGRATRDGCRRPQVGQSHLGQAHLAGSPAPAPAGASFDRRFLTWNRRGPHEGRTRRPPDQAHEPQDRPHGRAHEGAAQGV